MRHNNEGHKPGTPGMHEEEEPNEEVESRGGRTGHHARGGRTEPVHVYNAAGSPTVKEAEDEEPDFSHGGHTKGRRRHARGGAVQGAMAGMRADRPRRGLGGMVPAQGLARGGLARGGRHHEEEEREEHKRGGSVAAKPVARGGLARGGRHHEEEEREEHKRGGTIADKSAPAGLARGGRAAHSPYSSGRHLNAPGDAKESRGYEGVNVPPEAE